MSNQNPRAGIPIFFGGLSLLVAIPARGIWVDIKFKDYSPGLTYIHSYFAKETDLCLDSRCYCVDVIAHILRMNQPPNLAILHSFQKKHRCPWMRLSGNLIDIFFCGSGSKAEWKGILAVGSISNLLVAKALKDHPSWLSKSLKGIISKFLNLLIIQESWR